MHGRIIFYIFSVSEEDKKLQSPFTQAPTASLVFERDKQAKARAHPPGASKILAKAREKAKEDQKRVGTILRVRLMMTSGELCITMAVNDLLNNSPGFILS